MVDVDLETGQVDYTGPTLDEAGQRIAAVLREHWRTPDQYGRLACRCGYADPTPGATFEAHLADVIQREALV
jgi:hypothetical protein